MDAELTNGGATIPMLGVLAVLLMTAWMLFH